MTSTTTQWPPPTGATCASDWRHLIGQIIDLKDSTGWGCALIWTYINHGDFPAARARMDELLADMQWWSGSPAAEDELCEVLHLRLAEL